MAEAKSAYPMQHAGYARPRCPHCNSAARVRTSRELSPVYREQFMQCTNVQCGFTYVVGCEVLRTLSPSGSPRPDVCVPQSSNPRAGQPLAANDH